jgi:hypothetical protein
MLRDRKAHDYLYAIPLSSTAVEPQIAAFHAGKASLHQLEDDTIYEMWHELLQITDIEVIVDPKIIADWAFPGWDGGDIGHTWLSKACQQEKPCT